MYLDVDKRSDQLRKLAVGPIPALRLLTPRGHLVQSHDGYLDADKLVEWLTQNYDAAKGASHDELLTVGEPNLVEVVRLIRQFDDRNAVVREAIVQRLLPYPTVAREQVVNSFREGNLATKLTALELLTEWKAPVKEFDPWRRDTFSEDRLVALDSWSADFKVPSAPPAKEFTKKELADAGQDIDRMLRVDLSDVEAIRERLARFGEQLLSDVYARLKSAETDENRERLLALRYRLVADPKLVLRWPGGLERLASSSVKQRHSAADELAHLATGSEQRLLLELFSDPDPLVREISLKGLKNIGGRRSTAALVKLLADPEPNVRAAVLKQLAEDASPAMLDDVAKYVETEKDADLVVHAIRYFRAMNSSSVIDHLIPLFQHESWQVRAEAISAITEQMEDYEFRELMKAGSTEVYKQMVEKLADSDSFVVAKAVEAVGKVDLKSAVNPLVAAAQKHPTLTPAIVDALSSQPKMSVAAIPHLKTFFQSENSQIRAAAIRGLCFAIPDEVEPHLVDAASDENSDVRIAAAESFLQMMDSLRPSDDEIAKEQAQRIAFANEKLDVEAIKDERPTSIAQKLLRSLVRAAVDSAGETEPSDKTKPSEENASTGDDASVYPWDQWLTELSSGKHRAKWSEQLVGPFENMLTAEDRAERVAAGLALVPLGKFKAVSEVLLDSAAHGNELFDRASDALEWLSWNERKEFFVGLESIARGEDHLEILAYALRSISDERSAELCWKLLNRDDATLSVADTVQYTLRSLFYGHYYYNDDNVTPSRKKEIAIAMKPRASSGSSLQRLVALNFLMSTAPDQATAIAKDLLDDSTADETLRADAFQIMLIAQEKSEQRKTVLSVLRDRDQEKLKIALAYLAMGESALSKLRGSGFEIDTVETSEVYERNSATPIIPDPPRGLAHEDVLPLLDDEDLEVSAHAGYLATLFGDATGMPPLIRFWQKQEKPTPNLDRLVYRAIASLDRPEDFPHLKEIYARKDKIEIGDFYWTIRIMSGREILQFRKQIRQEVEPHKLQ